MLKTLTHGNANIHRIDFKSHGIEAVLLNHTYERAQCCPYAGFFILKLSLYTVPGSTLIYSRNYPTKKKKDFGPFKLFKKSAIFSVIRKFLGERFTYLKTSYSQCVT
jgi:hypothetical protein